MITIGSVLPTRDGRIIGNAIVIDIYYSVELGEVLYTIKTDFGNVVSLLESELQRCFFTESAKYYSPRQQYLQQLQLMVNIANRFGFNSNGN